MRGAATKLISKAFSMWRGDTTSNEGPHGYVCDAILEAYEEGEGPLYDLARREVRAYLGDFVSAHNKAGHFTLYMTDCNEEPEVIAERTKLWNHLLIWARDYDALQAGELSKGAGNAP